jgi:hypothetical protein
MLILACRTCFGLYVLGAKLVSALSIENMGFSVREDCQIGLFFLCASVFCFFECTV